MRRPLDFGAVTLLAIGVLWAFKDPLQAMVDRWDTPMYSHAYVVPFISLGLLWSNRHRFRAIAPHPARLTAAPLLCAAILMLVVGRVAAIQVVQQLAFVLTIAAIVLFLFGFECFRVSAPAVSYLLFMVPFWDAFTEPLHEPFQHNSAQLGVMLMTAVGVPVYREGTILALPNVVIEVARACSGVNYLVAVLALALPLSFVRLHAWRHRLVLIGAAMTIAALANGLRVALIGVLAYFEIGSPLHGPFHVLHGLFVAGVGYVALFAGLIWLERWEAAPVAPPAMAMTPTIAAPPRWRGADAYGLALVFWLLVFVGIAPVAVPVALARPLEELPTRLGSWTAYPTFKPSQAPTAAWADADEHLRRSYRAPDGTIAGVDIWYFSRQQQTREVVSFRVAELHRTSKRHRITLPGGRTLTANLIAWPDRGEIGMFWYELAGTPESRESFAKLRSVWSVLRSGRNDAAAIMLTSQADDRNRDTVVRTLENLVAEVHMGLARHWLSNRPGPSGSGHD